MEQVSAAPPADRPAARLPLVSGLTPDSLLGDIGTLGVLVLLGLVARSQISVELWLGWTVGSLAVVAARHAVYRANNTEDLSLQGFGRAAAVYSAMSFAQGAWVSAFWIWVLPRTDPVLLGVTLVITVVWWVVAASVLAALPLSFASVSVALCLGPVWVGFSDGAGGWRSQTWLLLLLFLALAVIYRDRRNVLLRLIEASLALDARASELALAFATMADGVLVTGDGVITRTNDAAAAVLRRSVEEIRGQTLTSLLGAGAADLAPGASTQVDVARPDGSRRVLAIEGRTGAEPGVTVWVCRDVTDQAAREAEIRQLSEHDDLTGLVNRRAMLDHLGRALADGPVDVLVVDIDHFKGINDTHGHGIGDLVLEAVADRLVRRVAGRGVVARPGGDEFVVVIAAASGGGGGAELAAALVADSAEPLVLGESDLVVTLSVGVATGAVGVDRLALLHRADLAMYQAKRDGRDAWRVARPVAGTSRVDPPVAGGGRAG